MSPAAGSRTPKPSPALERRGRPIVVAPSNRVDGFDEFDHAAVITWNVADHEGSARETFARGGYRSYAAIGTLVGASAGSVEHWIAKRREPSLAQRICLGFALWIAKDEAEARAKRRHTEPEYNQAAPSTRLRGLGEGGDQ